MTDAVAASVAALTTLANVPAFTLGGAPATWLEVVAAALALVMVACNIREIHWGWPLAIASSLLYLGVFWQSRLYGDASLQIVFAVVALWGWRQWLRGRTYAAAPLRVRALTPRGRVVAIAVGFALWPATGWFLSRYTDTDVPWWDAFPTAWSLVGQWLLGRKYVENWPVWIAVNLVAVALFAHKGLWLTVGLYLVFALLAAVGWRAWRRGIEASAEPPEPAGGPIAGSSA